MSKKHTFHIPVMGIAYTIDSPLKVAQYGIDSVISLVDDILLEKLRKVYSEKFEVPFQEISDKVADFRAKRITAYLNLIQDLTQEKFESFKQATDDVKKYIDMLPDVSQIKQEFQQFTAENFDLNALKNWINTNLSMGSIDVNIMTKVDKENYLNGEKQDIIFNDAHAALRGFANSKLSSTLVLSAGMSPRLYSYLEHFEDFYPNEDGFVKKKIALKVSDYRSALIQGKFLAKKGIWVSEYRIESGLNCGGHAFATDGFLMGPILEEFRLNRDTLIESVNDILVQALTNKNRAIPKNKLALKITAQGGVGTAEEHQFLLDYYKVDSVGWGSPFLLVPEATTVDDSTRKQLVEAKEKDLYLSGISPLGVPFNSLRGNTKDIEKQALIDKGRPGSSCPKEFLKSTKEFTERAICTASRQYQRLKLKELDSQELDKTSYDKAFFKITEKSCICTGLGTAALLTNDINTKVEGTGISICPGPNMAYFSKTVALKDMVGHIYGKTAQLAENHRPNFFIKELNLYLDYFKNSIEEAGDNINAKQQKYFEKFAKNLQAGIDYYQDLMQNSFSDAKDKINADLETAKAYLEVLTIKKVLV
jgi:hypothetical protein